MKLDGLLKRIVGFGQHRNTEDVQLAILTYLDGHGSGTPEDVIQTFYPSDVTARTLAEVLQAAQILVNRREITATRNGVPFDPVNGDAAIVLRRAGV